MSGDFVNVRLTALGVEAAAGGTVKVHEGDHSFYFTPGEEKRVTRAFDWERVLRNQHLNGNPLFEIVPADETAASGEHEEEGTEEEMDEWDNLSFLFGPLPHTDTTS